MAAKTFVFKDAIPSGATAHRSLQDGGSVTAATTGTGWVAGTNAVGQSCIMNGGVEIGRTNGQWGTTLRPDATAPSATGEAWRTENTYNGVFANANWTFTFGVRSVTAAYTGRFKLAVRVWRGTNANGVGATEITSARQASAATTGDLSTSADTPITITWSPGGTVTLTDEYLFVTCGVEITTAATSGTTKDIDFRVASSTYTIATSDFSQPATVNVTGVNATGNVTSPTVAVSVNAAPAGVAATGNLGAVTVTAAASTTVNAVGVAATGAVGAPTVGLTANVAASGVAASGNLGAPTVSGSANVATTGVAATGAVGTVAVSLAVNQTINVTGVSATGALGAPIVNLSSSYTIAGVAAAGGIGSVTVTVAPLVNVVGVAATGNVGAVQTRASASVAATGVAAVGNVGAITVNAGGNISVAVTGVAASGHIGQVVPSWDCLVTPAGIVASGALGSIALTASGAVFPQGVAAAGAIGSVLVDAGVPLPLTANQRFAIVQREPGFVTDQR